MHIQWLGIALLGSSLWPGLAGAQQAEKASSAAWAGLAAPVTLTARSQTLEDLLHGLNSGSKAQLDAAGDARWDRVTIFAPNLPLNRALSGLSQLLHDTWDAETKPPPARFTLTAGVRARDYERRLWEETLERAAGPLFRLPDYLRTPAEEYQRQEQELEKAHKEPNDPLLRNGNLWYLGRKDSRNALALLATLTPKQRITLLNDERMLLRWNEMNDRQRKLAQALALSIGKDRQNNAEQSVAPFRAGEIAMDSVGRLQQSGLALYVRKDPVTGMVSTYGYGLGGATYAGMQLDGIDGPAVAPDLLPVRGNPYQRGKNTRLPTYTDLERRPFPAKFTLEPGKNTTWAQMMEQLAQTVSLPLFSDDFTVWPTPEERGGAGLPKLTGLNLEQGLDALCNRYHRLWWYADGTLFFRSRTWFIERQYEVPPPVLTMLRKQLAEHGQLDTQALTELSRLTRQQLEGLNATTAIDKGGLKLDAGAFARLRANASARESYYFLQFYARLDENRKRQALTPEGLAPAQMTPEQQQAFLETIYLEIWSEIDSPLQEVRFQVKQEKLPQSPNSPSLAVMNVGFQGTALNSRPLFAGLRISYAPNESPGGP